MEGNQNGTGTGGAVNFGSSLGGGNTMKTSASSQVGVTGTVGVNSTSAARAGVSSTGQRSAMPTATNNFGPTVPIASGTGDVTLESDKKTKKWWLIGGFLGVIVIAAIIFAVIKLNGGFGARASDLKSAFNIYANYYLTGEAKDEDLPESDTEDEGDGSENVDPEMVSEDEVFEDEEGVVLIEEDDEMDGVQDSYFARYIGGEKTDGDKDYLTKLKSHFDTFYDYYTKSMGNYQFAIDYIDEYKQNLDLLVTYYNGPAFDSDVLLEQYNNGGEEAAEKLISEEIDLFEEDVVKDEISFQDMIISYGESEIKRFSWYESVGCLVDGTIDYECAMEKEDENEEVLDDSGTWKFEMTMFDFLNEAEAEVYDGIFRLNAIVNRDDPEFNEDEVYVKENDGEDKDEE